MIRDSQTLQQLVGRQTKPTADERLLDTGGGGAYLTPYRAVTGPVGGWIQVKRVNSDGSVTGPAMTVAVFPLPEA